MTIRRTHTHQSYSRPVVSLFDESANMLLPWAQAGHTCYAFDIINWERKIDFRGGGSITWLQADLSKPAAMARIKALDPFIVFGFPPCTDLAVSGAKHFKAKLARDPHVFNKAVALCKLVEKIGNACQCAWMLENPVSRLATMWRRPDFYFHPHQYGGYLPANDVHPRWPEYIAPRDAYPKKTGIWHDSKLFVRPVAKDVGWDGGYSVQFHKLGGKSAKTKQIRAETPRGYAQAVYKANKHLSELTTV